jgi:hypothetical protein
MPEKKMVYGDYNLVDDTTWVRVKNISIHICSRKEGVKVSMYKVGEENQIPLTESFVSFESEGAA